MNRQLENYEIESLAKAAHEVNRAYCEAMGDNSHAAWDATAPDLKAIAKQACIGIAMQDHNEEQSHEAWVAAKRSQGWNFGDKKDEFLKTHPCLTSFANLPIEQQVKDRLWVATVKNMTDAFWKIPRQ